MRIVRVYANFQTELQYAEHYLAEELYKDGHTTTFITSNKYYRSWKQYISEFKPAGHYTYKYYDVFRLKSLFPMEKVVFIELFELPKILKKINADIIHLYGINSFTTVTSLWILYLMRHNKAPIIISDHTSPSLEKRGIIAYLYYGFFKMQMSLLKNAIDKFITVNAASSKFLARKYQIPSKDITTIPLGYSTTTFYYNPKLKNNEQKMILGFAGKINPMKRIDFLIASLQDSSLVDKIKLIIVGYDSGSEHSKSLLLLAKQSSLSVEFRPLANKYELAKYYNYIDVAVFPGSISITTVEANGCGTPSILYEFSKGLEYRVEDGRGMLFSDKKELIDAIGFYYKKYKSGSIDNASIETKTKEKYSWGIIKDRYLEVYREALNSKKFINRLNK